MKVVRFVHLWMKEGTSDQICEVDLVDLERLQDSQRYLVNFRYGRRGTTLRDDTKTPVPIAFADAEKIFDSVVVSKVNDGYRRMGEETAPVSPDSAPVGGRDGELLKQLAAEKSALAPDPVLVTPATREEKKASAARPSVEAQSALPHPAAATTQARFQAQPDRSGPDPVVLQKRETKSRFLTAAVIVFALLVGLAGGPVGAAIAGVVLYAYFIWWRK